MTEQKPINNPEIMKNLKIKFITNKLDNLYREIKWDQEEIEKLEDEIAFIKFKNKRKRMRNG